MSGLAVLYHRDDQPVDPLDVEAMLTAVPYRGPDGMWIRCWSGLALGYAKLAITVEDQTAIQPLISPRSGCAIIADVRLDNREDLLRRLPDRTFAHMCDAELILCAYEAWGTDTPLQLIGDFAFVLWDPHEQRLVCARDTHGQRTLFFRMDDRVFAAASEIHQLLQEPSVPIVPNDERIRDFLVPLNAFRNPKDTAETFYRGIYALAAAHLMIVDRQGLKVRQYWDLAPGKEICYRTDDEYVEHFQSLFFDVVRTRLRSAYPVAALLSGGLDSASMVCTAQELYRSGRVDDHGFMTFSSTFDTLECDERPFIRDVQSKYGFDAHLVPWENWERRLRLDPTGFSEGPNLAPTAQQNAIQLGMAESGARVQLTGEIADSCISGSRLVFDSLLRQRKLREFRRHFMAFRQASRERSLKTLTFGCALPLLPLKAQRHLTILYMKRFFREYHGRILPGWMPEALREDLERRHVQLSLGLEAERRFSSPARENDFRLLRPPELGRDPGGWPVERRRPFADRRLHEFLLAIPTEQKFSPHPVSDEFYAGSKHLLRRAMRGILPESIRTRTTKTDFSSAVENEIQRCWPSYEEAFGPGSQSETAARGYIDERKFWERLQQVRAGGNLEDIVYMIHVAGLETWLRTLRLPRPQSVVVASRDQPGRRSAIIMGNKWDSNGE